MDVASVRLDAFCCLAEARLGLSVYRSFKMNAVFETHLLVANCDVLVKL